MKTLMLFVFLLGSYSFLAAQVEIGDDSGNITEFEQDGTMEFHGDATVYEDLRVSFTAGTWWSGLSPPTFTTFRGGTAAYSFSATSEEQLFFTIQIPHSWKMGSTIYPHIHWSPAANGSGDVVWGIEYTWVEYDPVTPKQFPTPTTLTATHSLSDNQYDHLITSFSSITPTADQDNISSVIVVRIFRDGDNASDTFSGEAFGLSFDIHYIINTAGSRQEFVK